MPSRPADSTDDLSVLVSRQLDAMAAAWDRGERPRVEEFLALHPELRVEDAVRLVYEETCLRQEAGEEAVTAEVFRRFPQWRAQLSLLLDCNRLLRDAPAVAFPNVGDQLGDFRMVRELGRGAQGRTYLASQRSLADRPVVLKVTPLDQDEHLALARLQQMNIVPLYFEQVVPDRHLRLLGMPYLGGAALDRVLDALSGVPAARRTTADLLAALDRLALATPAELPPGGPFRKHLARVSYVDAICWMGAVLADALQYAHDRGLVHLDVKPSNVLLAADGQPMLLDFHLARPPLVAGETAPDRLGGTPGCMSPEQEAALTAVTRGAPIPRAVDGRSDVYALGLLLDAALRGTAVDGAPAVPLERDNPRVSPGLAALLRKCLAHAPDDRYPDAAALASDLRRHLNDLPLRGVPNRSLVERWQKWRRRDRGGLARGALKLAATLAVVAVVAVWAVQSWRVERQAADALAQGREALGQLRYPAAADAFRRGLALAPAGSADRGALAAGLQRVAWEIAADELHKLVDRLRFRFGLDPPDADEARPLWARGLEVWKSRSRIARPADEPEDSTTAVQVRADLVALATLLADLRRQIDSSEAATQEARQILRDAQAEFGPSPALGRALRADKAATLPTPRTAWEHYDLGLSLLRSGDHEAALGAFSRAIDLQPAEFWPHYYQGIAAYRLGRHEQAAASFGTCVALAPRTAECYYNRALAQAALGRLDFAIQDDTRALEFNPAFTDAALNRGILQFRSGKPQAALADLERARHSTSSPRTLGLIEYNSALVHDALGDRPAARACLERAAAFGVGEARRRLER